MRRAAPLGLLLGLMVPAIGQADMGPRFLEPRLEVHFTREGKFVSVYAKIEPTAFGWPILFILAEVSAALFEGWLWYRMARLPFGTALLWSVLANGATFLVGCCLVGLTV